MDRTLVYMEDNQGYYTIPFIFKTDCNLMVEEMSKISHEEPGAGRFSTSFKQFQKLLLKHGYRSELVEEGPQLKGISHYFGKDIEYKGYECVLGAPGNY